MATRDSQNPGRFGSPASRATALALAGALLAGCSGGIETTMSEPGPPSTPPPTTPADEFDTQWGLAAIGADRAYDNLARAVGGAAAPGAGVTIGFIDSGIDLHHPEFAGGDRTVTEDFLLGAQDETTATFAFEGSSHGTAVASVAAAARDGEGIHGVAWGANVKMFAIPLRSGGLPRQESDPYIEVSLAYIELAAARNAAVFTYVLSENVDIVNASYGIEGIVENYQTAALRQNAELLIEALAQRDSPDKTIVVWAAGNAHGHSCESGPSCVSGAIDASSVEVWAGLPLVAPELRGHVVAAAAVTEAGGIANFSNRCGVAADWCIAAPGSDMAVAYFGYVPEDQAPGRGWYTGGFQGTSYAAPMVSGGLAVMKQLFRSQLSNTALVARLFATADKDGIYADRDVYGQGMMDLDAATRPVGTTTVAADGRVGGAGAGLAQTRLALGRAFGDGLAASLAGREIAAFDSLGAPFWFDLGSLVGAAAARSPTDRLRTFMAPDRRRDRPADRAWRALTASGAASRIGPLDATDAGGHLALAGNAVRARVDTGALAATAFASYDGEGFGGRPAVAGAALSWRPSGVPAGLKAGWLLESDRALGARSTGAFGTLAAQTTFAGIQTVFDAGSWRVGASAELGVAAPRHGRGLIADLSGLTTSAFALDAQRRLAGGRLHVSLSQPLRVETGRAALSIPVGRTPGGAVLRQSVTAGLAPSGRQIDAAAEWRRPLAVGEARLGIHLTRHPRHDSAATPDAALLAGWRTAF